MCFVAYNTIIWSCCSILACTSASKLCIVVPCFPSHPPSPTQLAPMYRCRYTKLFDTINVISAQPDDFLRMVTLNHATLWVGTIPHITLENGHVSLKRIHLM